MFNESMTVMELLEDYRKNKERLGDVGTARFSALSAKDYISEKRFLSEMCDAFEYSVACIASITTLDTKSLRTYEQIYGLESDGEFAERLRIISADMNKDYINAIFCERYQNDETARAKSEQAENHFVKLMESPNVSYAYNKVAFTSPTVAILSETAKQIMNLIEQNGIDKTDVFNSTVEKVYDSFYTKKGCLIDDDVELSNIGTATESLIQNSENQLVYDPDDIPMPEGEPDEPSVVEITEVISGTFIGTANCLPSDDKENSEKAFGGLNKEQLEYMRSITKYVLVEDKNARLQALRLLLNQFSEYLKVASAINECNNKDRYCALSIDLHYIDNLIINKLIPMVMFRIEEHTEKGYKGFNGYPLSCKLGLAKNEPCLEVFENSKQVFFIQTLGAYKHTRLICKDKKASPIDGGRNIEWVIEDTLTMFKDYTNATMSPTDFVAKYSK